MVSPHLQGLVVLFRAAKEARARARNQVRLMEEYLSELEIKRREAQATANARTIAAPAAGPAHVFLAPAFHGDLMREDYRYAYVWFCDGEGRSKGGQPADSPRLCGETWS